MSFIKKWKAFILIQVLGIIFFWLNTVWNDSDITESDEYESSS